MVQVTQTEDEINIVIAMNRLLTRKPDIVLLPKYLKFNNPPIFFERHLTDEIDDEASYCRIFKKEARIVLIKRNKGIWPEIFQTLTKEELYNKRVEISDQIIEKNKEKDKEALEKYDQKRRTEIEKEVRRHTEKRERVKLFEENARREALMVDVRKDKDSQSTQQNKEVTGTDNNESLAGTQQNKPKNPIQTPTLQCQKMASVRTSGKINVQFSNFNLKTPRRESQPIPMKKPPPPPPPVQIISHDGGHN